MRKDIEKAIDYISSYLIAIGTLFCLLAGLATITESLVKITIGDSTLSFNPALGYIFLALGILGIITLSYKLVKGFREFIDKSIESKRQQIARKLIEKDKQPKTLIGKTLKKLDEL